MNFSIVMIAKNEEATLPRLFASLKKFKDAGGEIVVVDTGSKDNTADVARDFGCVVEEVGTKFNETIYEGLAQNINNFFVVDGEANVVKGGDNFFNFSAARNYAASLAKNDMILSLDADEVLSVFDFEKICEIVNGGYTRIEHYQIYTHEADGSEGVKFLQSKFYDRSKTKWSNYAHEMLAPTDNRIKIGEDVLKIDQWQVVAEGLHTYIPALAADVYYNQSNPRNCHYFARELFYSGRLKSALKQFERHLAMELPPQEYPTTPTHLESMLFISNIYGRMGMLDTEIEWCHKAIKHDPTRREPVMRLAHFYKWHNKPKEAKEWALKAAAFDWDERCGLSGIAFKRDPEAILRWANSVYPMVSIVIPTLGREEKLQKLLESIKENAGYDNYEVIVERDQFPPNNVGVPKTFKKGVEKSKGELVMYLGNDCIARKDFLKEAVNAMVKYFPALDGLVSLNDGYWYGEVATHFLAGKKLLPLIGGEFFHTGYHHTGCDSELTQMARKLGKYIFAEEARIYHDHPIQNNFKKEVDEVYKLAYDPGRRAEDNALYHSRAKLLGFEFVENFKNPFFIPRKIYTIWLNTEPTPDNILKSIETQRNVDGFEHELITLENCDRSSKYVQDCLSRNDVKGWVKASDYLRLWYLYKNGGIYIDAATDVLKPFSLEMISSHLFVCRETNGFVANGIIGVEQGHPLLKKVMDLMETLDGKSDAVFQNGMAIWNRQLDLFYENSWGFDKKGVMIAKNDPKLVRIYPPEYFLPYNHETGQVNITKNSVTLHHYLKSWQK